jgi:putative transposase
MATTNSDPRSSSIPFIDEALLDQLMAQIDTEGLKLLGPDGVLTELTDHMGYEPGDPTGWGSGNNRNGSSAKTVLTDAGSIPVIVPQDRNGTFEPKLIPKYQRRLNGFNDLIISLIARGMTTRDVQAHIADVYQVEISPELVSKITDSILPQAARLAIPAS